MKIVLAPDSFKGSLTALDAAQAMQKGILSAKEDFGITESIDIIIIPMADGGEGTVDAIVSANHGRIIKTRVLDPLGREIGSFFGVLPDNTAVIEMAAASGLNLIKSDERNPMKTTTYGTGQLIKHAVNSGCKNIIIGIRPENINIPGKNSGNERLVEFNVDLTELMGAESYIYLSKGDFNLISRIEGIVDVKSGDKIKLALDLNKIHVFDADTQLAIL